MKETKLLLIRHAPAELNLKGKFIGSTDVSADRGAIESLRRLEPILNHYSPEAWFASPMLRATQTLKKLDFCTDFTRYAG